MGSRIAAHLANAGFPVDLLDIVLPNQPKRNQAALIGIESASKQKPVAFMTESAKSLIAPGRSLKTVTPRKMPDSHHMSWSSR